MHQASSEAIDVSGGDLPAQVWIEGDNLNIYHHGQWDGESSVQVLIDGDDNHNRNINIYHHGLRDRSSIDWVNVFSILLLTSALVHLVVPYVEYPLIVAHIAAGVAWSVEYEIARHQYRLLPGCLMWLVVIYS